MEEQQIKLALCGLPTLVADSVTELVRDNPNVQVVAKLEPGEDLWAGFERSTADLMICSLGQAEMNALWTTSLARRPPYAVLNLVGNHRSGRLYALYPERATVQELSAASLLDLIATHLRSLRRADSP